MMCDFYLITITDLEGNVIGDDQFGPDFENLVPKSEVCTCNMWAKEDSLTAQALIDLVAKHLKEMAYGTLIIERLP